MRDGILWCPHCGGPHSLRDRYCGKTGASLEQRIHNVASLPAQASPRHPIIGTTIAGRYRITKLLGAGGMGHVFEAEHLAVGGIVAVKILRSTIADGPKRLLREAELAAAIRHPNICAVFDLGFLPSGDPFLVMERLTGETFAEHLRRRRRLSPIPAIAIFEQLLSALQAAHSAGVLHRDLKPQNVILVEREHYPPLAKLLDFGFAKDMTGMRARAITQPRHACGTPQYMSPEQLRAGTLDARSDLFAVGVMLFEALTGRHPFIARATTEIAFRILERDAPPLRVYRPRLSAELEKVVARALAKSPEQRFPSAEAMLAALEAARPHPPKAYTDSEPDSTTGPRLPRFFSSSSSSGAFSR